MLAEGLPPAAVTLRVANAPASIAATAQRDNDASKRVPVFIDGNLRSRRELVVMRGETRERLIGNRRGANGVPRFRLQTAMRAVAPNYCAHVRLGSSNVKAMPGRANKDCELSQIK